MFIMTTVLEIIFPYLLSCMTHNILEVSKISNQIYECYIYNYYHVSQSVLYLVILHLFFQFS